jgi:hypothetical protein
MSATPGDNLAAGAFAAAVAPWPPAPAAGVTELIALGATGAHRTTAPATSQTLIRELLTATLRFTVFTSTAGIAGYQYYSLPDPGVKGQPGGFNLGAAVEV